MNPAHREIIESEVMKTYQLRIDKRKEIRMLITKAATIMNIETDT